MVVLLSLSIVFSVIYSNIVLITTDILKDYRKNMILLFSAVLLCFLIIVICCLLLFVI